MKTNDMSDYRRKILFERMEQRLLEIMGDYLDDEELQLDKALANIDDPVSREESELHIRMAKAALEEVTKTNMEHLHLFTPVSEAILEFPELYLVRLNTGGITFGWFQGGWFAGEGGITLDVTHVLDLSKLTTKERARISINEVISLRDSAIDWDKFDSDVEKIKSKL